jgi:hypothetical protein
MLKARRVIATILLSAIFTSYAGAQEAMKALAPQETKASAPAVTASASGGGARYAAPGEVLQIRLEIYSATGELVFDSGQRAGGVLDWKVADVQQGMVEGSYISVVTVKDLRGKLSQRLGSVTLQGGNVTLGRAAENELSAAQAQAVGATRLSRKIDAPASDDSAQTILRDGKERSVTVTTHDGQNGQVTSTSGALKLSTGDVLTGNDKEHVRITEQGQVGIGTTTPEATLDVAGTIRARGGIRFDDGTVLNSATALGAKKPGGGKAGDATLDGSTPDATVVGAGTTGSIVKWTDGTNGTAGDSAIVESAGNVGIGTNSPQYPLHIASPTFGQLYVSGASAADFLMYHTNAPANTRWTGLRSQDGRGKISSFADSGAYRVENILTWNNSNGNVGIGVNSPNYPLHIASPTFAQLFVSGGSAADFLMYHTGAPANARWTGLRSQDGRGKISSFADNGAYRVENILTWDNATGNMSVGAAPGTEKMEVLGNLKINGATNGIIFSDGSKMTSANAANAVQFVPATEQLSVGDANGTAPMINLRGGSTCCSGPGGHTPAWFKVFQNGSFVATGNLGIGVSPMQGKGYRTSWDSYKGAFRSGYADNEWDDANVGFFSWAGGSNSTAIGLYALAFGDTNSAESTSSIVFGSGNQVKGAAGFAAGAGNRVCDTYGVAFGNKAQSGGPLINGKCDPDSFNLRGLAAVAIGYNVTADQDHTTAMGKFASNNGFAGTFIWSDGSATASADTFRNTANNEFAARATGGFRFRTNLTGTTGCNLPAGSGVFNCTSSRTTKENFLAVDGDDVLNRLREVPVSSWNYITEGSGVRHLGPMAEDFHQAFGLGTDSKSIGVQDLAGVSLVAVKALEARATKLQESNAQLSAGLEQKTAEVEQLRSELKSLRATTNTLAERLDALEQSQQNKAASTSKPRD